MSSDRQTYFDRPSARAAPLNRFSDAPAPAAVNNVLAALNVRDSPSPRSSRSSDRPPISVIEVGSLDSTPRNSLSRSSRRSHSSASSSSGSRHSLMLQREKVKKSLAELNGQLSELDFQDQPRRSRSRNFSVSRSPQKSTVANDSNTSWPSTPYSVGRRRRSRRCSSHSRSRSRIP
jgi:hypothetical protein